MSDLLKIARAVRGDDFFSERVRVACDLAGAPFDAALLTRVARAVVDHIELSGEDGLTVSTAAVTDEEIIAAVGGQS